MSIVPSSGAWADVRMWRRSERERLLARRQALSHAARGAAQDQVIACLRAIASDLPLACVGAYWPFKGEVDLHPLLQTLAAQGTVTALPVVLEKQAPMVFRRWSLGEPLARGIWDIPVPANDVRVSPSLLLIPLVGFDRAGYRLGYGGGYYDRTLAAAIQRGERPLCIGVGYADSLLETIHPQAHDVPMDRILTEHGWFDLVRDAADAPEAASSPCQLAEAAPAYMGYLSDPEIVVLLNELLAAERAGARGVATMAKRAEIEDGQSLLQTVAHDEASFCAMLSQHLKRLRAQPTDLTGSFYDKLLGMEDYVQQLAFLNRGQCWVVRKLREALPRVRDARLAGDLRHMLDVHVRNIEACEQVIRGIEG